MRKNLNDCLELIQSPKIKSFTEKALSGADPGFWKDPCSGSGKYHPPENQVKGGIIVHIRKGIQIIISLFRIFNITDQLAKDKMISAFIVHDICKNGIPWGKSTHSQHGLIVAQLLADLAAIERQPEKEDILHIDPDLADIIELARNHMGIWTKPEPTPALEIGQTISEKSIWHLIIQLADYWATRKWCPFIINELVFGK